MLHGNNFEVRVRWKNRYGREMSYSQGFEGVIPYLERNWLQAETDVQRARWAEYLREVPCAVCGGKRLKPEVLAVLVDEHSIADVADLSISDAQHFMDTVQLSARDAKVAAQVLREIRARLEFLSQVGPDLPHASPGRRARSPAARRSASGSPPRSAPGSPACSTCWTSRASASTSGTTAG